MITGNYCICITNVYGTENSVLGCRVLLQTATRASYSGIENISNIDISTIFVFQFRKDCPC